jgi:hypothetical protein
MAPVIAFLAISTAEVGNNQYQTAPLLYLSNPSFLHLTINLFLQVNFSCEHKVFGDKHRTLLTGGRLHENYAAWFF